jgi:hypothetical protein
MLNLWLESWSSAHSGDDLCAGVFRCVRARSDVCGREFVKKDTRACVCRYAGVQVCRCVCVCVCVCVR